LRWRRKLRLEMKIVNNTVYLGDFPSSIWLRKTKQESDLIFGDILLKEFKFLNKSVYFYIEPFQYNKTLVHFLTVRGWYILFSENYTGRTPVLNLFDDTQRLLNDINNYKYEMLARNKTYFPEFSDFKVREVSVSIENAHKQWINNDEYKKLLTTYNISLWKIFKFMFSKEKYIKLWNTTNKIQTH